MYVGDNELSLWRSDPNACWGLMTIENVKCVHPLEKHPLSLVTTTVPNLKWSFSSKGRGNALCQ